jgi:hypothetical protein
MPGQSDLILHAIALMSKELELKNSTDSFAKDLQGKYNVQYRFETPDALSNVATATAVASMQDRSMPTAQVNRDLIGQLSTPDYGYKQRTGMIKPQTLTKRQHAERVISKCQHAFSELMHEIGNAAATYQKQEIDPAAAMRALYSSELPTKISTILSRQMPLTEFGMRWDAGFQVFYGTGKIFANHEATSTLLTHDLAHLLIASCGNLPWCPKGEIKDVLLAEYNAVFIENILTQVYNHIVNDIYNRDTVLFETIKYMRWFADVHYAQHPFPIPSEEAYRRFCWNMDVAAIVRLSPLFFAMTHVERTVPEYRNQTWELHFNTEDITTPALVAAICPDGPME